MWQQGAASASGEPGSSGPPVGVFGRIKSFFAGSKLDRERLAALGFGAFSAYGVISNINAGILVTISWITIVKQFGATPLDNGMWPKFLAVYAGLWVSSHFLRPVRLSLAIAAAPFFDAAMNSISQRLRIPKLAAFGIVLVLIALGTSSLLVTALAACGGFPNGLPWLSAKP